MILLKQQESGIVGSLEDIQNLAQKDSASILLISDSHRNPVLFEEIVRRYGKHCDAIIFTGDGIADLIETMEKAMDDDELGKALPPVAAFAQGNCDPAYSACGFDPTAEENISCGPQYSHHLNVPHFSVLCAAKEKILISHGHLQGIDFGDELALSQADELGAKIILHGHTHVPRQIHSGNKLIVNPGSISRPRGGFDPTFAVLTIKGSFIDAAFINIKTWNVMKSI
ncbi:MAG: YfcE family phosphodiesterase [Treponema sp.]|nr:YfcE family phosphodiesterase [Treponema sp.]